MVLRACPPFLIKETQNKHVQGVRFTTGPPTIETKDGGRLESAAWMDQPVGPRPSPLPYDDSLSPGG